MTITPLPYSDSRAVDGFHVHPVIGILSHMQRESWKGVWRRRPAEIKSSRVPVPGMDKWTYHKMDGLWFRVKHMIHTNARGKLEQVIIAKRSANRKEIAWMDEQLASGLSCDLHRFGGISDTRLPIFDRRIDWRLRFANQNR